MYDVINEEFNWFLKDMAEGQTFCKYLDETDYEDDYSHKEIDEAKSIFANKVRTWLHENLPGKYIVSYSWCVFVMTEDEVTKRGIFNYELVE